MSVEGQLLAELVSRASAGSERLLEWLVYGIPPTTLRVDVATPERALGIDPDG